MYINIWLQVRKAETKWTQSSPCDVHNNFAIFLQSFIAKMGASSWRVEFQAPGSGMRDQIQWFLPKQSGFTSSMTNTCTLKGR